MPDTRTALAPLSGRRVFVSGGAGVIGRQLVAQLAAVEAEILVGDLKPRPAAFPAAVRYRQGDLNAMRPAELAAFAPEVFIHLAATFERSTETWDFWDENARHNLGLSHHLMGLVRDLPSLAVVVFASSYLIYDQVLYQFPTAPPAPRRLREDDPIQPRNLTGGAKLMHEVELDYLRRFLAPRVRLVAARIFRGYGRGSRCVISRFIRAALAGEAVQVYRPEGRFDYVFADDTAEGLLRLAACDRADGVINLGTGKARAFAEVLAHLQRRFPALKAIPAATDIPCEASEADNGRLRALLGWSPSTSLEDGIDAVIASERAATGEAVVAEQGVLISSLARKAPLVAAVRAAQARTGLKGAVVGGDADAAAPARAVTDGFWHMPRLAALDTATLVAACRERHISAIIPTRDGELAWFAQRRDELAAAGIAVMVSPAAAIGNCSDKLVFAQLLREWGAPAIETRTTVGAWPRQVVKERFGAGSRGLGLDLDPAAATSHAAKLEAAIFQPFVAGRELSIDCYVDGRGRCLGAVARRREVVVNGESQVTASERHPRLETLCADLSVRLGLRGHACWQVIEDAAGGLHIIECNPRVGGASTLSWAAGLDSLAWFLIEARGGDPADLPFTRVAGELRQVRLSADTVLPA